MQKTSLITQAELARRLNVSEQTIYKGAKSGRFKVYIKSGRKYFNYQNCKRVFIETSKVGGSPRKIPIKRINGRTQKKIGVSGGQSIPVAGEVPEVTIPHDLADARIKYEKYKAMKEQFNFEVLQKKYIASEDVEKLLVMLAQNLKKSILSIPDRIGPIVAGETDQHKVRQMMIVELKQSLQNISDTNLIQKQLIK